MHKTSILHFYLWVKLLVEVGGLSLTLDYIQYFPAYTRQEGVVIAMPTSHIKHYTYLLSLAQRGHSCSNSSSRQFWWKECSQRKWTAGRDRPRLHRLHFITWKILALQSGVNVRVSVCVWVCIREGQLAGSHEESMHFVRGARNKKWL